MKLPHARATPRKENGMTLVELLVAIAITLLIVPVLYTSIDVLYRDHARTFARAIAMTHATEGLSEMVRDVRAAVYGEDGSLPLITIGTSTVAFYTDTDLDGDVERVRYSLTGTTLQKGVVEPTATSSYPLGTETVTNLITNVTNNTGSSTLFTYYTATSSPITTQARILDVRRVTISLEVEIPYSRATGSVLMRSSASIRNLKNTY